MNPNLQPKSWHEAIKPLTLISLPVIGLNVLNILALVVDFLMCGRLPNNNLVLAALGYSTSVVFIFLVATMGLSVGTVALVSRAIGSEDKDRAEHVFHQSFLLALAISAVVAILGNLFGHWLVMTMGADPETADKAMEYLSPLLTGSVFYYLAILFGATLRGTGNTMVPFLIAILVNVLNGFINYSLIFGEFGAPQMGLSGAATGTVISQSVGVVIYIIYLRNHRRRPVTIRLLPLTFVADTCKRLIKIGLPAALDMVVFNVGILAIVTMLSVYGDHTVAAHGVGFRVSGLAFIPGLSISQATGALVGISLGASNVEGARSTVKAAIFMCVIVMTCLGILTTTFAPQIVEAFAVKPWDPTFDPAVVWIRLLGVAMPLFGIHIALIGLFQGAGATPETLKINITTTLLIQIPLSALLGFGLDLGYTGVWAAFPLSFFAKLTWLISAYRRGLWIKTGKYVSD